MRGQVLALLELAVWETEHNHLSLWSVWWQLCYKEWDKQPDKSWADGGVVGMGCRILWDKPRKVVLLDDFWAERRSKRGSEPCRFRQGNVPVEIMVKAHGQGHGGHIRGPARAGGGPWRWGHKGVGTFHAAVAGLWRLPWVGREVPGAFWWSDTIWLLWEKQTVGSTGTGPGRWGKKLLVPGRGRVVYPGEEGRQHSGCI